MREPGLRAYTPGTPERARDRDTWAPLTWDRFLLTEPAPQAFQWSGDCRDLERTGSGTWSSVSQALGPAPGGLGPASFAGSEGAAGQNVTTSASGASSWWRAPAVASSTSWDCSFGPDRATYWSKGLGEQPRASSAISWGPPSDADYTTSWDSGLLTDCTASSKGHLSPDLTTLSELSQQPDRAALSRCYPKSNHRGERSARPQRV